MPKLLDEDTCCLRTKRRAVLAFLRRMEFYATHLVPKLLDEDTCCWSTRRRAVLAFVPRVEGFATHRVPKLLDEDTCCWRTRRWAVSKRYYKTLRVTLLSNFVCRWCKEDFPITSHLALHHFDRSIQFSDSLCFFVLAFLLRIVSIGLQFNGSFWSWRQAFGGVLISNHPTIKGTRAKKWYFPQNFVIFFRIDLRYHIFFT